MILATTTARTLSAYPFAPLKSKLIPDRQSSAAINYTNTPPGGVDHARALWTLCDLEQRAEQDLEHLMDRAMTYAGALGQIDALHIEWGQRSNAMDDLDLWTRLGRILREAGI